MPDRDRLPARPPVDGDEELLPLTSRHAHVDEGCATSQGDPVRSAHMPRDLAGYLDVVHVIKGAALLAVGERLLPGQGWDLLQHAYVKALEHPAAHAHRDPNKTANWLHKRMRWDAIKWRDRAARQVPLDEAEAPNPPDGDSTAGGAERRMGAQRILDELARLADRRPAQAACLALDLLDFRVREGAAQLGLTERQYIRNLGKARRAMSAICDESGLLSVVPPALLAAAADSQDAPLQVGVQLAQVSHDGMLSATRGLWSTWVDGWHTLGFLGRAAVVAVTALVTLLGFGWGGRMAGWTDAPAGPPRVDDAVSKASATRTTRRASASATRTRPVTVIRREHVERISPRRRPVRPAVGPSNASERSSTPAASPSTLVVSQTPPAESVSQASVSGRSSSGAERRSPRLGSAAGNACASARCQFSP
jgi:DNA-directed RNA polymerase specialized sigma24 family protein